MRVTARYEIEGASSPGEALQTLMDHAPRQLPEQVHLELLRVDGERLPAYVGTAVFEVLGF